MLPQRIKRESGRKQEGKRSPAHRKWVRGHACSACGSLVAIECAHVRGGTDGGMGIKPSDRFCISLCKSCHSDQHRMGEETFAKLWDINLNDMADEFFKKSPHRGKLGSY
jgi:hypothetical protein